MHVFEIMPIHNLIKIQNNQLSALYTCVLFFFWSYLGAYILEYLYRESSDIEGPEIDGHVTHGAHFVSQILRWIRLRFETALSYM